MPTDPLKLFQALLQTLHIPLTPPTLSSIPPSLLLLTLERILGTRIPLADRLRRCDTQADELALVKCLIGIMADDELLMDLTALEPIRVVQGGREELGVICMGLVVVAKRRGVFQGVDVGRGGGTGDRGGTGEDDIGDSSTLTDSTGGRGGYGCSMNESGEGGEGWLGWEGVDDVMDGDVEDYNGLREPLEPDVTLSSPILPTPNIDVFGDLAQRQNGHHNYPTNRGLFGQNVQREGAFGHLKVADQTVEHYFPEEYETPMPRNGFAVPLVRSGPDPYPAHQAREHKDVYDEHEQDLEKPRTRELRDAIAYEKVTSWREREDSQTTATTSTMVGTASAGHRTVLQEMMDEFGLG